MGESPLQSLRLLSGEKEYTLPEVLAKYRKPKNESEEEKTRRLQEFKNVIHAAENCTICGILFLLDYELQIQQTEKEPGEIATEPLLNMQYKNCNRKFWIKISQNRSISFPFQGNENHRGR